MKENLASKYGYNLFLVAFAVQSFEPRLSLFTYFSALVCVFSSFLWSGLLSKKQIIPVALLIFSVTTSLLASNEFSARALRDVTALFSFIFLANSIHIYDSRALERTVAALVIATVGEATTGQASLVLSLDYLGSTGLLETSLSFTFAALAIFAFASKKWFWFFVALLFTIITFKRAALLATLIVFIVYIFTNISKIKLSKSLRMAIIFMSFTILTITSINIDYIYTIVSEYIGNASANQFSLGRYNMSLELKAAFFDGSGWNMVFGQGPGAVNDLFFEKIFPGFEHVHNDYLKMLFDYGVVGASCIVVALSISFSQNRTIFYIGVFSAFLFVTDNTLIYLFYMVPVAYLGANRHPSTLAEFRTQQDGGGPR